jgi:hypothetical protein
MEHNGENFRDRCSLSLHSRHPLPNSALSQNRRTGLRNLSRNVPLLYPMNPLTAIPSSLFMPQSEIGNCVQPTQQAELTAALSDLQFRRIP